ncbi:DUF2288 domain-containing protein [Porticoccus sp. W117]|uniref:DUF2288 domain-containing protein n=1 Tax=Porticoccus sp. W117 TaxID=3054777 RepID=UPI0025974A51|nr:DUF2288 domain-containing protein [Porticoccus sp. W117]MDM3872136.1 DUF2288 domain-containing protein [Porticoccus sp. W117]
MKDDIEAQLRAERDPEVLKAKLNLETARVHWHDLQRFFASGSVVAVAAELDMTEVALQISLDNSAQVKQWMAAGQVAEVSDKQAQDWYAGNTALWTCVVKPWVLVQETDSGEQFQESNDGFE